jgi:hypothetical protein
MVGDITEKYVQVSLIRENSKIKKKYKYEVMLYVNRHMQSAHIANGQHLRD